MPEPFFEDECISEQWVDTICPFDFYGQMRADLKLGGSLLKPRYGVYKLAQPAITAKDKQMFGGCAMDMVQGPFGQHSNVPAGGMYQQV